MSESNLDGPKLLAWAGWQLRIPALWRPLDIEGNWKKGSLLVGDMSRAFINLQWWRPDTGPFDEVRWIRKHLKKGRARLSAASGVKTKDFRELAWILESGTGPGAANAFWYGYSRKGRLAVEIVINQNAAPNLVRLFLDSLLPTLAVTDPGQASCWSLFDASFITPPGFDLKHRRVNLGDLSLQFKDAAGSLLTVRQVYPAQLALSRRELARWLKVSPFKTKYNETVLQEPTAFNLRRNGTTLNGMKQKLVKKLPFPLGFIWQYHSWAAVVHDPASDRLLAAEYDAKYAPDENVVAAALLNMNRTGATQ